MLEVIGETEDLRGTFPLRAGATLPPSPGHTPHTRCARARPFRWAKGAGRSPLTVDSDCPGRSRGFVPTRTGLGDHEGSPLCGFAKVSVRQDRASLSLMGRSGATSADGLWQLDGFTVFGFDHPICQQSPHFGNHRSVFRIVCDVVELPRVVFQVI